MPHLKQIRQQFSDLTTEQKYQELLHIFGAVKEKNNHCSYIYHKLLTDKQLFDNELLDRLFDDVLAVYQEIKHHDHYVPNKDILKYIHQKECGEKKKDEEESEVLLLNI